MRSIVSDLLTIVLLALSMVGDHRPDQGPPASPEGSTGGTTLISQVTFDGAPDLYPSDCTAASALVTVEGFLAAFNAGDPGRVMTYVAEESTSSLSDGFRWFWHDGVEGIEPSYRATDLASLSAYVALRHEQGEVMRLSRLHLQSPAHGVISFHYDLVRTAADLGEFGAVHSGKGAMRCADYRLIVWGMAKGKPAGLGE